MSVNAGKSLKECKLKLINKFKKKENNNKNVTIWIKLKKIYKDKYI